jgi:hypothetical protein
MFNQYYAKREQYQDMIREAEKERMIRQIQKANREKNQKASNASWEKSSWIHKISWAIREARQSSAS